MMTIQLNGKSHSLPESSTLTDMIASLNLSTTIPNAIAVNRIFIPKTNHQETILQPNDKVDIITPMQGG